MANIMINKVCNLKCKYCFANKFVNKESCIDKNNISLENFKKAVNFILKDNQERIGIIGGEPLLHPHFKEFMEILFNDNRVKEITIFTNGINLDKYFNLMANPKVNTLINLNSPNDIGEVNYKKILDNIDHLVNKLYLKQKISLGINMYSEVFDYEYILDALKKFGFTRVRTSIVVPNTLEKRKISSLEYFSKMKPRVLQFFKELQKINVVAGYDCNAMPQCVLNEDERMWVKEYVNGLLDITGYRSNIGDNPKCTPVIDILPNLEAVRCFGCSNLTVPIHKFYNINDLRDYFKNKIDSYCSIIAANTECESCYYKHTSKCSSGCLAFKSIKVINAKNKIKEIGIC